MNDRLRQFSITALAALALLATPAFAQYGPDDEAEALEAMKPQVEEEAKLPPPPDSKDWIPVDTGPTSRHAFAIDAKSLTVSNDVVRYTVMSTSSSGAKNVSYEGIDCRTGHFRRYAFGTADGKWTRSRRDHWERVSSMSINPLHFTLRSHFFCRGGIAVGKAEDMINRLRTNSHFDL